ncbi:MAG: ATP synthase F0 subunit B [Pyrinomonadaceae bacterium]
MYLLAFAESIQLFPDGTLFIHIALILIMIWVLNRTFFRPINRIIESREKHKGGRGGEAETILKDVAEKQGRYNKSMLEARSEGYEMIEKLRAEAVSERQAKIATAKEETAQAFADEKKQLEDQTAEARASIAKEAEEMSDKIVANILQA